MKDNTPTKKLYQGKGTNPEDLESAQKVGTGVAPIKAKPELMPEPRDMAEG